MQESIKNYKKGDVITREGDVDFTMYEIMIGSVGVYKDYGLATEKCVAILSDGEFVGEMEMVSVRARSATLVALQKTEVRLITRDEFTDYVRNYPEKMLIIMQQMSDRIRKTTEAYSELLTQMKQN